ncbi:dihydropteroate synthase [Kytococcus sedentarius]|uniref:dihydropteroate synthase n=1 Tax=Kytococcus sedentarius TaxID=1276 RepID=UPI0035BBC93A
MVGTQTQSSPGPSARGLPTDPDGLPLVMGIVNVTPDSFSDGGRWADAGAARAHAEHLVDAGAQILDVGGESTRPGSDRVPEEEELRRVLPVVRDLAGAGWCVSVDTTRARVAAATLEAGATLINDVSGGLADPDMFGVVADAGAPYVLMHWRGHSQDMYGPAHYDDVAGEVLAELGEQLDRAVTAGVAVEQVVLDPGFGFAKTAAHNWVLMGEIDRFVAGARELGCASLIGVSRKGFLGQVRQAVAGEGDPVPAGERDVATATTSLLSAQAGAWSVRVHDVQGTVDALGVLRHARRAAGGSV